MISSEQIKSARALLGISSKELAELAGVGWATIRRFENLPGIPEHRNGNLDKVRSALEARGIEFLGDPIASPGVRLHKK